MPSVQVVVGGMLLVGEPSMSVRRAQYVALGISGPFVPHISIFVTPTFTHYY
jgi:hypothetical protein